MPLLLESELREIASHATSLYESVEAVLERKIQATSDVSQFDIFLSNSSTDKSLILGAYLKLVSMGYAVYVDWIKDKQLNRNNITSETATLLRLRMKSCRSLFFSTTENSSSSKWMPWELGFMDGFNGKSAILPISKNETENYSGQEYLCIYPYVSEGQDDRLTKNRLWINKSPDQYVTFEGWINGKNP